MSKAIRKIPWAVPGLAAVALAAFLAIGLLATYGVQPAAAQDAGCEVAVNAAGEASVTAGGCDVQGDTATVVFQGDAAATEDRTLSLLIADSAGPITAYPNGTAWDATALRLEDASDNAATAMKYRYQSITVPKAKANPTSGVIEGQKVSVMVNGNVYVWAGSVSVTAVIADIPAGDAASGARQIAASAEVVDITFLGAPAIGVDSTNDRDTVLDDEQQFTLDANDVETDTLDASDLPESRSKLVSSTEASAPAGEVTGVVIDGGSADHVISGAQAGAEITATVKDADNNPLEDVEVTFTATSEPVGIESSTRVVDTVADGTAVRTVSGLPANGPYKVSVEVTAGSLNLGTIVIQKAGSLHEVTAISCVADADNEAKDDGCGEASRPSNVFKPGDSFSVNTETLDALGIDAGSAVSIDFGDAKTANSQDVFDGDLNAVMIHADAPQGRYNLTVEATEGTGTSKIDREATVEVIISGAVSSYGISGSRAIALAPFASEEYTISAMDSLGNPPIFAEGKMEDEVTVLVESALNPRISGLDGDNKVKLNPETGQAKITIFKPANATEGDTVQIGIFVNSELKSQTTVTFGTAPAPDFSAPSAVTASSDAGVVTVDWTPGDSAASQIVIAVNVADDTDYCLMPLGADASSHTCDPALTAGETYVILVIALDGQGGYALGNVVTHTAN